jgi:hypothetical protein
MLLSCIGSVRAGRAFRLAAVFAASAQFAVIAIGPVVDGLSGEGTPSHVEAYGIHLHYSHNPDDCAACAAASLVGVLPRSSAAVIPEAVRIDGIARRTLAPSMARLDTPKTPRAPPHGVTRAI